MSNRIPISQTLAFVLSHPVNKGKPISAMSRLIRWQLVSRLKSEVVVDWINDARLVVKNGMTGATGNIYCGLHEYEDMSFMLHLLRPDDLFLDVGANIGSYTILASRVSGSNCISVEPDPVACGHLLRNVEENEVAEKVEIRQIAVGEEKGFVRFSVGRDTTNQVLTSDDAHLGITVPIDSIDAILGPRAPAFIKLDVEGHETQVLRGAVKTLSNNRLLAIAVETIDAEAREILHRSGFEQYGYHCALRKLIGAADSKASNSLFVRDLDEVGKRLAEPRKISFRGRKLYK